MAAVGYARVSTRDQNPESQIAVLERAGVERVFTDRGESSRIKDRPEWQKCLDFLREGDLLVIYAMDRIAGTERMAIETINDLADRGISLRSLSEPDIDTTTPQGRAMLGIFAVFAQLRVDTIRANTRRGLDHARAQGRVGGRPTVMSPDKVAKARRMRDERDMSYDEIAKILSVGASSVRRALGGERKQDQNAA